MNKFSYIKSLWSPFVPFKIKFYAGKTKIGTPYFLPRKWVKDPNKPGHKKAIDKKIGFDFVSTLYHLVGKLNGKKLTTDSNGLHLFHLSSLDIK